MNMSALSRVSRTRARIAAVRRSRRGRRRRFSAALFAAAGCAGALARRWLEETGVVRVLMTANPRPSACDAGGGALEVRDQRIDQVRDRIASRHHRRRDAQLLGRFGRDRADRGDDRGAQQVGRLILAEHRDEVADGRGARERDGVDLAVEQHPVDVGRACPIGAGPRMVR